jgi:hypothetical protein
MTTDKMVRELTVAELQYVGGGNILDSGVGGNGSTAGGTPLNGGTGSGVHAPLETAGGRPL